MAVVVLAELHHDVVDVLRADAGLNHFGHGVEALGVEFARNADALNLFGGTDHVACRHQFTLAFPVHHLLVEFCDGLAGQAVPASLFVHHHNIMCPFYVPILRYEVQS